MVTLSRIFLETSSVSALSLEVLEDCPCGIRVDVVQGL